MDTENNAIQDNQIKTDEDKSLKSSIAEDNADSIRTTKTNKPNTNNLTQVKAKALKALVPLIEEVRNVSPERKFDICLSAIRLTDSSELAQAALDAALAIEENGTKAEALVELINEINYLEHSS